MSRVLKQTKENIGSTSSSLWTWKQVVKEYFIEDENNDYLTTNKSIIVVESYLGRPSGQSTQSFGGTATTGITCDGDERSKSQTWNYGANNVAGGGWCLIQSEEFEVEHNSDGTKKISISSSLSTSSFNPNSASASGEMDLITIPRATACPNLDGYIESSAPISLNPASTSFKHRLYYSYNGKTGYYPSSGGFFANTGSLSLDSSFYSYTPRSSGTGSITLYTYDSNGNLIGSKTGSITVRCDADKCRPSISATIIDTNEKTKALTGNNAKLVKGFSNAQVIYEISAKNGASIKSKTINGKSLGTSPYTINGVSTGTFEIKAIDSRDFPKTEYKYNTLVDYIPLTLDFVPFRPTETGSAIGINFQGNYFNGSFGSVNNELSLSWKYRVKGDNAWIDGGTFVKDTDYIVSGNRFESIGDVILSDTLFDYQTNYEIAVYYADKLVNTYTSKPVIKGQPVLSWEDLLVNVNGNLRVTDTITAGDVKCKNLLNLDGFETRTINGLTFTKNKDKSITINGTATQAFGVNFVKFKLKAGTYHLSLSADTPNSIYIYDYDTNTSILHKEESATFTKDYNNIGFDTWINQGEVFNNLTIYPQLEEGDVATNYVPYKAFGIESGSNSNGSWVKFDDGTMICHGTKALLIDIDTLWGETLYIGNYTDEIIFPHEFIATPDLTYNCNPRTTTGFFCGSFEGIKMTKTGFSGVTLIRPNSRTNVNAKINFIAIGRWK